MEDFFQNMLQISKTVIPIVVVSNFIRIFPDALNVEWYLNGEIFEAVFHENELEKIAFFDIEGNNLETKVNLPLALLSSTIASIASTYGEIMNAIKITNREEITFEIIVRDLELNRYRVELDDKGIFINKNLL
jgi:hypothetical protein